MINRELIRIKVVQLTYAHYQNGTQKLDAAEKELFFSLSKAYDLYIYMLQLMVDVNRMAERAYETASSRARRLGEPQPSSKFVENQFMAQLASNAQLKEIVSSQKKTWADDEDFVRRIWRCVAESDIYKEWMERPTPPTYEEDRDLWRRIYKNIIAENEELDQLLEEKSLYWNDDRFIINTFVLKTINRFDVKSGTNQELLPEYRDEEDREFAKRLFRASLLGAEHYRGIISQFLRNWDLSRIAFMDLIIMQNALAEMLTFPQIPVSVTINEYVNIAKFYSTPRSGAYINGMLDAIARSLIADGKLRKEMPEQDALNFEPADYPGDDAAVDAQNMESQEGFTENKQP